MCSRKTGKPLARAIVWGDSRTRGIVIYFENLLESRGIEIDGKDRRSKDGALEITQVRGCSRALCHRARASVHTYPPPHVLGLLTKTSKNAPRSQIYAEDAPEMTDVFFATERCYSRTILSRIRYWERNGSSSSSRGKMLSVNANAVNAIHD